MSGKKLTFGEKLSDLVARFGGSWMGIITCSSIIILWIVVNTWIMDKPFDPFPYILLNLALSCVAALQAPFILMANKRQESKDRQRGEEDLAVNKKAELYHSIVQSDYVGILAITYNGKNYLQSSLEGETPAKSHPYK
jgi:uncharacterized membrane protein